MRCLERRTAFEARLQKRRALDAADKNGELADSMEVRTRLMDDVRTGRKTLAEVQKELTAIKRNAKKNGKLTRSQVWSRS